MCILTITLKIPIKTEPLIGAPALTFTHWLPLGEDQGIAITEGGINLLLWFDLQATRWASQPPKEDEIKNQINILVHHVRAKIKVSNIEKNLASYMENRDFARLPSESEKVLQHKYDVLGQRILRILIENVNRLIAYARAYKGQYWLLGYRDDPDRLYSYFQQFESFAQVDNGNNFRFQPGIGDTIRLIMTPEEKYISASEWDKVREFVQGKSRAPLVGELLAEAEQLAGNGYRRSALAEAVTALEVALSDFGRSHNTNSKLTAICSKRLGIDKLHNQIEHMGLSGTVGYLLPLIFPEEILASDVLAGCREALTQRQNVVHNGQRDVEPSKLRRTISSIKKCCDVLIEYTNDNGQVEND